MEKVIKEDYYPFWDYYSEEMPINILAVGEVYCSKDYVINLSCSEHYAFEYIIDGRGFLEKDNRLYETGRGDIIFLPIHSRHRFYTSKTELQHKIYVIFSGACFDLLIKSYMPKDEYVFRNDSLTNIFYGILEMTKGLSDNYSLLCEKLYKELFTVIYNIKNAKSSSIQEKLKREIECQIYNEFDLKSASRKYNYSVNHLIRIFKEAYGITPYQYYLRKKIECSEFFLINTDMTNEQIAEKLNFASLSGFYNCFKKAKNITPVEYKKLHKR